MLSIVACQYCRTSQKKKLNLGLSANAHNVVQEVEVLLYS